MTVHITVTVSRKQAKTSSPKRNDWHINNYCRRT